MVNKNLIEVLYNEDKDKLGLAIFWTFLGELRKSCDALYEVAELSNKENTAYILKKYYEAAFTKVETDLKDTFLFLVDREKQSFLTKEEK